MSPPQDLYYKSWSSCKQWGYIRQRNNSCPGLFSLGWDNISRYEAWYTFENPWLACIWNFPLNISGWDLLWITKPSTYSSALYGFANGAPLLTLDFSSCISLFSAVTKLRRKAYLGSCLQPFQSLIAWLCCFDSSVAQHRTSHVGWFLLSSLLSNLVSCSTSCHRSLFVGHQDDWVFWSFQAHVAFRVLQGLPFSLILDLCTAYSSMDFYSSLGNYCNSLDPLSPAYFLPSLPPIDSPFRTQLSHCPFSDISLCIVSQVGGSGIPGHPAGWASGTCLPGVTVSSLLSYELMEFESS